MEKNNVEKLIIKYLTHSISKKEWNYLNTWINNKHNQKEFQNFLKINYVMEDVMKDFDTEKTKASILEKIKKDKKSVRRLKRFRFFKYAAFFILLIGIGYALKEEFDSKNRNQPNLPIEQGITLEFEDGNLEAISEGNTTEITNKQGKVIGKQVGNRIVYSNTNEQNQELEFNRISVPYGKKFEIEFSDGTVAFLNSGTSIRYPINFLENQPRDIYVVGEAFLDVVKDSLRPFTVKTLDNLSVEVLGTKFNISNYPEDQNVDVVLVEGSVAMDTNQKASGTILEPGFKGSFNKAKNKITKEPVITNIYTSWMNGNLIFRNMTFENIIMRLERHYNVKIINENTAYSNVKFNANFGEQPINKVLEHFRKTYSIEYKMEKDYILIF